MTEVAKKEEKVDKGSHERTTPTLGDVLIAERLFYEAYPSFRSSLKLEDAVGGERVEAIATRVVEIVDMVAAMLADKESKERLMALEKILPLLREAVISPRINEALRPNMLVIVNRLNAYMSNREECLTKEEVASPLYDLIGLRDLHDVYHAFLSR